MKNTAPRIPIRLPTNSTVLPNSASAGAHNNAINPPTIIIGIPTPTQIALEAIHRHHLKNVYEVCDNYEVALYISLIS